MSDGCGLSLLLLLLRSSLVLSPVSREWRGCNVGRGSLCVSSAGVSGVRSQTAPGVDPRVSRHWPGGGSLVDQEGFFRSGPAQGSDGMSTGLNLAMIGSGVDGGFLAFLPMAYVFCCQ